MARHSLVVSILVCALALLPAAAADVSWTGGGDASTWEDAANWSTTPALPAAGDNLTFPVGSTGSSVYSASGSTRTVGTITFEKLFEISTYRRLTINGGVTSNVAGTCTIITYETSMDDATTWDIGAGSTVAFSTGGRNFMWSDGTLTKTGDGTLDYYACGGYNRGHMGAYDIQGGTVLLSPDGSLAIGGVSGTGTMVARSSTFYMGWGDTVHKTNDFDFQGYLEINGSNFYRYNASTQKFSGAAGRVALNGNTYLEGGRLLFDNSAVHLDGRIGGSDRDMYLSGGTLALVGNDSVGAEETAKTLQLQRRQGTVSVTHGAAASATMNFNNLGGNSSRGMLLFTGNDLGAPAGGNASRIMFATAPTLTNDIINGWTRAGTEFATYDTDLGVQALDATGRPGAVDGAGATDNVLVNSAQTPLSGATSVNSLKIDGAHALDLDGNTLTIASGGLIQTGAANNGIGNGTLSADRLYVQTDTDLTIDADIAGTSISKMGDGRLTVGGALPGTIYWLGGDLEITGSDDVLVSADEAGGHASFYMNGTGVVTMRQAVQNSNSWYQYADYAGDVHINSGTVQFGAYADVGVGTKYVRNGASLYTSVSYYNNQPTGTVSLESGGRYVFYAPDDNDGMTLGAMLRVVDWGEVVAGGNQAGATRRLKDMEGAGRLVIRNQRTDGGAIELYGTSGRDGFTGVIDVAEGILEDGNRDAGGMPANMAGLNVRDGGTMWFSGYASGYFSMVFSGDGKIVFNYNLDGSGSDFDIKSEGSTWRPGSNLGSGVGTLNLDVQDLVFQGTTNSTLEIQFDSSGNDVLAVKQDVEGLSMADVVLSLPVPSVSFDCTGGLTGTFLTATGSISGGPFASVAVDSPAPLNPAVSAATVASYYNVGDADLTYDANSAGVSAAAPWTGHDGDANLDDTVDVFDLAVLANNYSVIQDNDWTTADYDRSGVVDVFDLALLANNYGWTAGGGEAVPEPAALAVLAMGALAVLRKRRR